MEVVDIRTKLHACSIERLNRDHLFVCGTYELNEGEYVRNGEIVVLENESVLQTVTCESGVLDMKYSAGKLCVALSHGSLCIYNVDLSGQSAILVSLHTAVEQTEEGLFLSVDIDLRSSEQCWKTNTNIVVSMQSGSILVFTYLPEQSVLVLTSKVASAHTMMKENMPAWIAFFNPHSCSGIVSGGDDCVMKLWNIAADEEPAEALESEPQPLIHLSQNRNTHTAGVTSGQWHPLHSDIYATGSYDEHVRIWDQRLPQTPLLEIHTGGGLWRVKWVVPEGCPHSYLVLACMHSGCRVSRINLTHFAEDGSGDHWEVQEESFVQHRDTRNPQHLAYGVDVLACTKAVEGEGEGEDGASLHKHKLELASCSFYDNLIQLWSCTL